MVNRLETEVIDDLNQVDVAYFKLLLISFDRNSSVISPEQPTAPTCFHDRNRSKGNGSSNACFSSDRQSPNESGSEVDRLLHCQEEPGDENPGTSAIGMRPRIRVPNEP
jgi:hypothetical protein